MWAGMVSTKAVSEIGESRPKYVSMIFRSSSCFFMCVGECSGVHARESVLLRVRERARDSVCV
jgi:hypothetical protein